MTAEHADYPIESRPLAEPASVRLDRLTKRFAARRSVSDIMRLARPASPVAVVDRVSLQVAAGEVFGLLGPNGAGKTTIFKMLSTLITPDSGSATVAGSDVVRESGTVRRLLSAVPADERSLNWRLSARENLRLFGVLQGVPHTDIEPRIDSLLDTVGLSSAGRQLVAEFSTGMRQRLLIARALISRPRILLLDEPTRGLDPLSAQALRQFIRDELVGRQRCTILLATHNADEAFGLCDRVAVLHRGRVLATGAATELAGRFADERIRVVTQDAQHPIWSALERRGLLRRLGTDESRTGAWTNVECSLPGGPLRSARVLRILVERGVRVARLERMDTSLAELITRIIDAEGPANA